MIKRSRSEVSYGIIPLRERDSRWWVFLVQHREGHWGFPKGHPVKKESHKKAAERELKEETGLNVVCYLKPEPEKESYTFFFKKKKIEKEVSYFLAQVKGNVVIQDEEILDGRWATLDYAPVILTYQNSRDIIENVIRFLLQDED